MPQLIEAITYVSDPGRTLPELRVSCEQAQLDTTGTLEELRARLMDYLTEFTANDDIVCLNPEPPSRKQIP